MSKLETEYISLISKHQGIIHRITGLYTDTDVDRQDLHQEILLQSWKGYQNFNHQSLFSTWLYKVSLNTALTFRKKEGKRNAIEEKVAQMSRNTVEKSDTHEYLYYLIKQLHEVDKMIITLHLDGFKNKEISEITGMTTNNVTVKLHRIKAHIIDQYKKESYGHI